MPKKIIQNMSVKNVTIHGAHTIAVNILKNLQNLL